jgi:hypothetical protein
MRPIKQPRLADWKVLDFNNYPSSFDDVFLMMFLELPARKT